jgi:hypothetical protein
MTRQELQARAADRAVAQHVKPYRLSDGSFAVPSATTDGIAYTVRVNVDGEPECTCLGFQYRQSCKHVEAVRSLLRQAEPVTRIIHRVPGDRDPSRADLSFEQFFGFAS